MYFALEEITSLAKDDERRKRKKDKEKDCAEALGKRNDNL